MLPESAQVQPVYVMDSSPAGLDRPYVLQLAESHQVLHHRRRVGDRAGARRCLSVIGNAPTRSVMIGAVGGNERTSDSPAATASRLLTPRSFPHDAAEAQPHEPEPKRLWPGLVSARRIRHQRASPSRRDAADDRAQTRRDQAE